MKILIKNAHDCKNLVKDYLIENGRIAKVDLKINDEADIVINAEGLFISPGLIDLHVHLREPGYEYKEDIYSGVRAALKGGFTAVCCMPNTSPVTDNSTIVSFIKNRAKEIGLTKVYPIGAITKGSQGKELAEMGLMTEAGAVAFSDDGQPVENAQIMRLALEYAKFFDSLIISHCEDKNLVAGGLANEGYNATVSGLKGNPSSAEEVMVAREIILAKELNTKVHIAHISTKGSVDLVRQAKKNGIKVSAETCPHYFTLTDSEILNFNANAKVNPPLRSENDRLAVIAGIMDGSIDCIVTDHAPHSFEEKNVEFAYALNGISGIETSFSLSYTNLVKTNIITMEKLIELMANEPRKLLKLDLNNLSVGDVADVSLFDLKKEYTVDVNKFESKGKNSPFHGQNVFGICEYVLIDGQIKLEKGAIL